MKREKTQSGKTILMAMFIAISAIGSVIVVQGTIAFDSMAAFLGALVLGPVYGGVIGIIGHMLTAYLSGFPLTLPVHFLVGGMMFVSCWSFGWVYRWSEKLFNFQVSGIVGVFVAVLLNGPISLALVSLYMQSFVGVPFKAFFIPMFPALTLAAAVNVILAIVVYKALKRARVWE